MNLSESYKRKLKNLAGINENMVWQNTPKTDDSEMKFPVIYSILTKETIQRHQEQKKPVSIGQNGYRFRVEDAKTLEKLQSKYPVGGIYKNETITHVNTQSYNKTAHGYGRY